MECHNPPAVARFLIVDDEPAVTVTYARMLEAEGHAVQVMESGRGGWASVEADPPDALVLDIRMPDLDGLEFLRRLRQDPRLAHIPVGIVTGDYFLRDETLAELEHLGATLWYKPLGYDDVATLARTLTGRAS